MKNLMSFNEAKKFITSLNLKAKTEKEAKEVFEAWWNTNKEYAESIGLPRNPEECYGKYNDVRIKNLNELIGFEFGRFVKNSNYESNQYSDRQLRQLIGHASQYVSDYKGAWDFEIEIFQIVAKFFPNYNGKITCGLQDINSKDYNSSAYRAGFIIGIVHNEESLSSELQNDLLKIKRHFEMMGAKVDIGLYNNPEITN